MGLTTQKYDILTRLAIGNGALVYRGVEKATNRQVALKLLVQDGDLDHRFDVDALLADSEKLRQITGAHVCQLLDAHTDDDGPVLVYEFANGVSGLELPAKRKLDAAQVLDVAAQLMSALRSGERQRRPHGDLKPSNVVFIDLPDGRPFTLVLDWGLAPYRGTEHDDSLPFLAPERLAGGPASHSADLFAAGATLFYLCTGKLLVAGAKREDLLAGWRQARPAVLGELRPDLSPKLVQWIASLLDPAPEKRPASAVDAATALGPLNPPPPPIPPESVRPRRAAPPSGISKAPPPPSGISKPPMPSSALRPAPTPAPASATPRPATSPARKPAKTSHALMTVALFFVFIALVGGVAWFFVWRKKQTAYLEQTDAAKITDSAPAPEAPASVGKNIGFSYERAPLPAASANATPPPAAPKPAQPPGLPFESFEYPDKSAISGLNGAKGWAGPWTGSIATVSGQTMGAPGSRGSRLLIPPSEEAVELIRPAGSQKNFCDPKRGGTWYFSCLLRHATETGAPGGELVIDPFNAPNLIRIVATDTGGKLRITLNKLNDAIELTDFKDPAFLVFRCTLSNPKAGKWSVYSELVLNPPAGEWPPKSGRPLRLSLKPERVPDQIGLAIRRPEKSPATTQIDEIRYFRSFSELKPAGKPAAAQAKPAGKQPPPPADPAKPPPR